MDGNSDNILVITRSRTIQQKPKLNKYLYRETRKRAYYIMAIRYTAPEV